MGRPGAAVVLHPQGGRAPAVQRREARAGGRPDHGRGPRRAPAARPELLPLPGPRLETRPTAGTDDRLLHLRRPPALRRRSLIPRPPASRTDRWGGRSTGTTTARDPATAVGAPLGQGTGVRCWLAGPGSDLSEELAVGVGLAALDFRVAPACPPGSAVFVLAASVTSCR